MDSWFNHLRIVKQALQWEKLGCTPEKFEVRSPTIWGMGFHEPMGADGWEVPIQNFNKSCPRKMRLTGPSQDD